MITSRSKLLSNTFYLKYYIPKKPTCGIFYTFRCGLCNEFYYRESVRYLNARTWVDIRISSLLKKKIHPKSYAATDHLLFCSHPPKIDA